MSNIRVIKRDGAKENLDLNQISNRVAEIGDDLAMIDQWKIIGSTISTMKSEIHTCDIDDHMAACSFNMSIGNPQYETFATRLLLNSLAKSLPKTFSQGVLAVNAADPSYLNPMFVSFVEAHADQLDEIILDSHNNRLRYAGLLMMREKYLIQIKERMFETPQWMYMRIACQIWGLGTPNFGMIKKTYTELARGSISMATPIMFRSGNAKPQLSSCVLMQNSDDSVDGIMETFKNAAIYGSKNAGLGIGLANVRAKGSNIGTSGRESDGVARFAILYNSIPQVITQGNVRAGSVMFTIPIHHRDWPELLHMTDGAVNVESKLHRLFLCAHVNNTFMKCVDADGEWNMFCPRDTPLLNSTFGKSYEAAYTAYVADASIPRKTASAREMMNNIVRLALERGRPYLVNGDRFNEANNLQHIGTLLNTNLCAEIGIPSGPYGPNGEMEDGVCILGTLGLPSYIKPGGRGYFLGEPDWKLPMADVCDRLSDLYDFNALAKNAGIVCACLDEVIDHQYYPREEGKRSCTNHRSLGIGPQGMAEALIELGIPYESEAAQVFHKWTAQAIWYGSTLMSAKRASELGTCPSFPGSPASRGVLQPDMWSDYESTVPSIPDRFEVSKVYDAVARYGLRNNLCTAEPPTKSTCRLNGGITQSFEPIKALLNVKRGNGVNTKDLCPQFVQYMKFKGLWHDNVVNDLIRADGTPLIPGMTKFGQDLFKTAYQMSCKTFLTLAAIRARYVDQSQSLNMFLDYEKAKVGIDVGGAIARMGWKLGLKTLWYYMHTKTVKPDKVALALDDQDGAACRRDNPECEACSA